MCNFGIRQVFVKIKLLNWSISYVYVQCHKGQVYFSNDLAQVHNVYVLIVVVVVFLFVSEIILFFYNLIVFCFVCTE